MFTEIRTSDNRIDCWQNETGEAFKRFMAGLTWPEVGQGYHCVMGEYYGDAGGSNFPPLKVLFEAYESSLHDLAKQCGLLSSMYFIKDFLADQEGQNEPMASLFYSFRKDLGLKVHLVQPSLSQEINSAIQVIRRRLKQGTLTIPSGGILASKFEMVNFADPKEIKSDDFPEIILAGSLIHEFDLTARPPKPFVARRPPSAMAA